MLKLGWRYGALVGLCGVSAIALSMAACNDSSTPATEVAHVPQQGTPAQTLRFDDASRAELLELARATDFDLRYGAGDQQRLMVGTCPGNCRHGPLADIQPAKGIHALTEQELADGRFVGRMISHDAEDYPKVNLGGRDTAYVWVDKVGGSWRAVYVPTAVGRSTVQKSMILELHAATEPWAQSGARWIWSDQDEGAWFTCTMSGCCKIDP